MRAADADVNVNVTRDTTMCCASYGITDSSGSGDANLKTGDAGDLVKYCSDECQPNHRPHQEAVCKETAAELRDEMLFKQPESSHMGDCPICCLPHSINSNKETVMACCGKSICDGCDYANRSRETEARLQETCPFCREPRSSTKEDYHLQLKNRAAANDPGALKWIGQKRCDTGDYVGAFEYWTKAAELGNASAHYNLSILYQEGLGVEKDEKKEVYHLEEAAIAGHPMARCNLAGYEWDNERYDRAVKHLIIAANLGYDISIQALKDCYKEGKVSKEDFAGALRAHYAAVNATKSPKREAAEKYLAKNAHRIVY